MKLEIQKNSDAQWMEYISNQKKLFADNTAKRNRIRKARAIYAFMYHPKYPGGDGTLICVEGRYVYTPPTFLERTMFKFKRIKFNIQYYFYQKGLERINKSFQ